MSSFKATYGYDFIIGQSVPSSGSGETLSDGMDKGARMHEIHEQLKLYIAKAQEK
jgi:hypothetical protein